MSKITYTPYLKKKYSTDRYGILQIRRTENRKSTYFSLSESLKEVYWNKNKGEVRANHLDNERLNNLINNSIDELKLKDERNDLVSKKPKLNKPEETITKVSFIDFFNSQLSYYSTRREIGSYKAHKTSYNHLLEFLKTRRQKALSFDDLNTTFVRDFETFLIGKGLSTNTCIKYLKTIKNVFKKGIEHDVFISNKNPFSTINKSKAPVNIKPLTKLEIETIFKDDIDKKDKLYNVRNYFLFQIFSQGMRVSDLFTLRWGNLTTGTIVFYQFKTKKPHRIPLNEIILFRLVDYLPSGRAIYEHKFNFSIEGVKYQMNYQEIEKQYHNVKKENISKFISIGDVLKGKEVEVDAETLKLLENWLEVLKEKKEWLKMKLIIEISKYGKKNSNKFVFPILDNKIFEDVEFNGEKHILTKYQYNQISSKTTMYNKDLKKLQEKCKIERVLTSHLSRHSYTGLMIEATGKDIYTISKSLGHSNITTTEEYVSHFLEHRVLSENEELNNQFTNIF